MDDKSVWVDKGTSRFDGHTWATHALPPETVEGNITLRKGRDGALWIIAHSRTTTRYGVEFSPPETEITISIGRVSQPGNTSLAWRGTDLWASTPRSELQSDAPQGDDMTCVTMYPCYYLPPGERRFRCRECHNLTYTSCQHSHMQKVETLDDMWGPQSYLDEDRHFVACVLHDRQPAVTGEDGLAALKISHAILASERKRAVVRVSEMVSS